MQIKLISVPCTNAARLLFQNSVNSNILLSRKWSNNNTQGRVVNALNRRRRTLPPFPFDHIFMISTVFLIRIPCGSKLNFCAKFFSSPLLSCERCLFSPGFTSFPSPREVSLLVLYYNSVEIRVWDKYRTVPKCFLSRWDICNIYQNINKQLHFRTCFIEFYTSFVLNDELYAGHVSLQHLHSSCSFSLLIK